MLEVLERSLEPKWPNRTAVPSSCRRARPVLSWSSCLDSPASNRRRSVTSLPNSAMPTLIFPGEDGRYSTVSTLVYLR
jgi:hypothetical protein